MNPSRIKELADQYFEATRDIRRHLHQYPELSFKEFETASFVSKELSAIGILHTQGVAGTGVVGIIEGKKDNGKVVALRADMDALPIQEENEVPYRSVNEGVMHACGHDVHTSSLLGAARILFDTRDEWEGKVKLIFQPGEEKLPGGASTMVHEGVLRNPDVHMIFGQHVYTPFDVGTVAFCPGQMMASTDELYIRIKGKGGHGAYPHLTRDPVPVAAQVISGVQSLVSRRTSPTQALVISIGKVIADGATNVIPDEVNMEGTMRTFDEQLREQMFHELETLVTDISRAYGMEAFVDIRKGYPSLFNDHQLTERAITRARKFLGEENVVLTEPRMGGEDFAFYTREVPSCFYRLGTGNPSKGIDAFIHTPHFDIDEDALKVGIGLMAWNAIDELNNP
jgi:amidohydrolase